MSPAIVLLVILIILLLYDFISAEQVLYGYSEVIGLDNYFVKLGEISKLEEVEHKDVCYSYVLITSQKELNRFLDFYKKIDFSKYNLLLVYLHRTPPVGYRGVAKTYRIIKKFNRIYLDLYGHTDPINYPGGDRCFGILIPKSDMELIEYIMSGKKIYVYR